ncbi:unnamed protein product [Durusdinium trenchii]|uniref:Uncharacterized protein n=2 Tax=Durusdinium trenchii TaxID=1381693 RepID=A0ABP0M6M8_9DINO
MCCSPATLSAFAWLTLGWHALSMQLRMHLRQPLVPPAIFLQKSFVVDRTALPQMPGVWGWLLSNWRPSGNPSKRVMTSHSP